jgi:hypothetical protein
MRRWTLGPTAILLGIGLIALIPAAPASAHEERDSQAPDGSGSVPTYRTEGPALLVCNTDAVDFALRLATLPPELATANQALWNQCQTSGFRHLQEAVNQVNAPGMIIKILPGVYLEEPSLGEPTGDCANLPGRRVDAGYQILSYEDQVACPHNQNLVAILGKENLQIEGTGAKPEDVVIDAQYQRLNAIRADRSSGIYLRNFTAQKTTFNAVYIMESDGFVIDKMVGRWNDEYGFLTFADDHGLYTDCEAYGNGDSGLYPGAASNINENRGHDVDRYAIEIRNCYSHDNLLGYSGTAGDSVWAHDNRFIDNTAGVATDSAFPGHPGLPQNHALFERNVIGNNNRDYYPYVRDGTCQKPSTERGYEQGVVCPAVGVPPGTGVINPGGNYNIWRDNWVFGNSYAGFVTSWVPGFIRADNRISAQFDTSHHNRYYGNHLGLTPEGTAAPNGMDFWWDGQGVGSCWQDPSDAGAEPRALPGCGADDLPSGPGTARYVAEPAKILKLYVCSQYDLAEQQIPTDCDWFGAQGLSRIEVKFALGEALLLGLIFIALWWRLLRGSGMAFFGVLLSVAGLVVGVIGTAKETTQFSAIGLALLGTGWIMCGVALRRRGRPGLAFLTMALGVLALLGAIDRGLYMLPWIPVPPSLWRIVLEIFWVPAAIVASIRGRLVATAASLSPPPATGDPLERFTSRLRF